MNSASTPFGDTMIMLRRNFKHTVRYPVTLFNAIFLPIIIMLMFVWVFGGAFDVKGKYINYAVPGMLVMAITYGLSPTAAAVNGDMTKGIINRFKAMDVSHGAVLAGHVVTTTLRSLVAIAGIIGVGFLMGFRPHASFAQWLGVTGLVLLLAFAASWLTVALGLSAKTVEAAGMATTPLILLPFLSSTFVPADTMAAGVRQFAEYQPFTPIIETLRRLLAGEDPSSGKLLAAIAWCVGLTLVGYVWSVSTFKKRA
ncbi:ABC transporter permease [Streptomyces sp. NPDC052396]|uniref:ABC transporter permease n=1 Tax=Streptomyces sp. NPDC052396 TaxID=3365689 RepID=UPI0037D48F22